MSPSSDSPLSELPVAIERDAFFRSMLRELAGALEDVIGVDDAAGFISVVSQRIGDDINERYRAALKVPQLSRPQVADVLVDLKRRINGGFRIVEQDDEKIVFANTRCPFAEQVIGRPTLCMMTSNLFGSIAADNLGYAKLVLQETIARGDAGCRVVLYLKQTATSEAATGREYFQS